MNHEKIYLEELGVTAEVAAYVPAEGVGEWHIMLHVEPRRELFEGQMQRIMEAQHLLLGKDELQGAQCVLKRYFLSDSTNQQPFMPEEKDVTVSYIQQQPLDGSKVAAWLYLQRGMDIRMEESTLVAEHNGYRHLWRMGMCRPKKDSSNPGQASSWQTEAVLSDYEQSLQHFGATLADHCIRTWFFVRDVDTQYAGLVKARRENFIEQGLTNESHYISSTGIGGNPADPRAIIQLGAYALMGFEPRQQRYLYAPTHLNPTYEYGVTFERGTVMEYGDRRHVFISGTASINNKGEVMHVGDIVKQTERMWENVGKLLEEGGASFDDVMHLVVYLRDTADYLVVKEMFEQRFPNIPTVFTLAPVCRPTWLIEMECMAIRENHNDNFRPL